jgi:hypothetical protein
VVEGFDKNKVYEVLVDYSGNKSKGYVMNITEYSNSLVIAGGEDDEESWNVPD